MGGVISSHYKKSNDKSIEDFPSYQAYMKYGKMALPVKGTDQDASRSSIYHMAKTSDEEFKKFQKEWYSGGSCIKTVEEMCKQRGSKPCLAYRKLSKIEKNKVKQDDGTEKTFETYVFEPESVKISYTQFWNNIVNFGKGLHELGVKKGDTFSIYEETRWEWLTTMYGCWTQGVVVSTVYANLGEDALLYALKETSCDVILCAGSKVKSVVDLFAQIGDGKKKIIMYTDELPTGVEGGEHQLIAWNSVLEKGKKSKATVAVPDGSQADELALVMYTSGTTGNPKGVMHTHGSLYCGVQNISQRVEDILGPMKEQEWYCSYLPLAHIMEFAVTSIMMIRGVIIGYGSPRTLMDQFAKPHGDLTEYKPLLFVAVPRVFDTMKKAVMDRLPKPGTLRRRIFDQAYEARLQALKEGKDTPFYNKKVFGQVRSVMGGRVYAMLSGGGPLSKSTQEFINVVFGMVVQGWGMTETVCCGGIQRTGNLQYDCVGQIEKTLELQLLDTEEFKHTDKPEPRGEILLRGGFLFKGYYKQEEQTKEALDSEGWFHTGDVGAVAENGAVRIVGRVKALAKNANGEYIALETLESLYGTNEIVVPNCACVLVDPNRSYIALLALTTSKLVDQFKKAYGLKGSYPDILKDAAFMKKVLESLQKTARDAKKKSFEVVQSVILLDEEWTPENGVLTAAMKLKRRVIDEKYKKQIEELFVKDK